MKVLVISQYFWPEEFRINDLARRLVERGHNVTVLTGIPNYPQGRFFKGYGFFRNTRQKVGGVKVLRVPLLPRGRGRGIRLALNYISFALMAALMAPCLCRGDYDVILVCQLSPVTVAIPAVVLKRLRKIPIILWVLDLWPESLSATGAVSSKVLLNLVAKLVSFIYHRSDIIAVASRGFIGSVEAQGVPAGHIREFPNWYEPEFSEQGRSSGEAEAVALPSGFVVLFAGNIGAAQGFETIVSAAERLKDVDGIAWAILGDGRRLGWLRDQVVRRGLRGRIHLLGRRPMNQMRDYFSRASALLVTLKPDPALALTIPGKIQSYMACGRPILAALDGEGQKLITDSGAGLVCAAGDAAGLASIVLTMYQMPPDDREGMGQKGRIYCESHFNREVLLAQLEGWMNELSTNAGASRPGEDHP